MVLCDSIPGRVQGEHHTSAAPCKDSVSTWVLRQGAPGPHLWRAGKMSPSAQAWLWTKCPIPHAALSLKSGHVTHLYYMSPSQ